MNLLKKKISKELLFFEYVKILNGVLGLSKREAEVFSFLLKEDSDLSSDQRFSNNGSIGTKLIRSKIRSTLNISEANLSRYLGTLKEKGLVVRNSNGKWSINDILRPIIKDNKFELRFILEMI